VNACRRPAAVPVLTVCVLTLAACSVPAEQPIIRDFFAASRLRDFTALSEFSTTILEPRERGTVSRFEIEHVEPERTDGDSIVKEVSLVAVLRQPDGQTVERPMVVTLRRPQKVVDDRPLYGGWKVVAVVVRGGRL
jgi:hypothetical protein